jgi:hypothetical protein
LSPGKQPGLFSVLVGMDSAGAHPIRHELKTWPKSFSAALSGFKKHEVRVNDRDFREGDKLCLREWDSATTTSAPDGTDAVSL